MEFKGYLNRKHDEMVAELDEVEKRLSQAVASPGMKVPFDKYLDQIEVIDREIKKLVGMLP